MKLREISFLMIILGVVICSCNGRNVKIKSLSFDTMKVVMLDLMNAEQLNNFISIKDTSLRRSKNNLKLYLQVFSIHHISKEQFYFTYQYYEEHPDKMKTLLDSLSVLAERQKILIRPPGRQLK